MQDTPWYELSESEQTEEIQARQREFFAERQRMRIFQDRLIAVFPERAVTLEITANFGKVVRRSLRPKGGVIQKKGEPRPKPEIKTYPARPRWRIRLAVGFTYLMERDDFDAITKFADDNGLIVQLRPSRRRQSDTHEVLFLTEAQVKDDEFGDVFYDDEEV